MTTDPVNDLRRRAWLWRGACLAGASAFATWAGGCSTPDPSPPPASPPAPAPAPAPSPAGTPRRWRLGFSPNPPRPTVDDVIRGIDLWAPRAELAVIHEDLPWADLLAGLTPDQIIDRDKAELVAYLRGKGLGLVFVGDATDGLDRARDARALRDRGRSLTEPAVQRLYRDYLLAIDRRLKPDIIGLAAETNLVRVAAPAPLYDALREVANASAADLGAAGSSATPMVSIQVETCWGLLGATVPYRGIAQDLVDFPFMRLLGLSSYPYFAYATPDAIPDDYYRRIVQAAGLPAIVSEGGWPSRSVGTIVTDPQLQARYLARQGQLLDSIDAQAWLHLLFADADLASLPQPVPENLPLFASIGLVGADFAAKPALAVWDGFRARPLG